MALGASVELILSMFITGPTTVTLPKLMWDAVRLEMDGTTEILRRQAAIRVPMS